MKIVIALTLTLLACQSDSPRPSAHADSGGKQIDSGGLQLSLEVSSAPYRASELAVPPLEAHLKNVGSDTITFVPEAVILGEIEIDGVWYSEIYAGSCGESPETLAPNATSRSLPIRFSRGALRGPAGPVDIPPGRHKVRLRTNQGGPPISIEVPGRRGIIVISNAVDIDVQ